MKFLELTLKEGKHAPHTLKLIERTIEKSKSDPNFGKQVDDGEEFDFNEF